MRLKQYITEQNKCYTSDKITPEEILAMIKRDCKPYLKQKAKGEQLYRGTKLLEHNDFCIITPRKDRKPRDTALGIHKKFDELFMKYHGIKARSEAVFTTPDRTVASYYGVSGIVFPVGNFKYLWNPNVKDLATNPSGKDYTEQPWYKAIFNEFMILISKDEDVESVIENTVKGYKSTDLKKAMSLDNEIMIFCDKYYIIQSFWYSDIFKRL
jgi:hypothetical protein